MLTGGARSAISRGRAPFAWVADVATEMAAWTTAVPDVAVWDRGRSEPREAKVCEGAEQAWGVSVTWSVDPPSPRQTPG